MLDRLRSRTHELQEIWKPAGLVFTAIWVMEAAKNFKSHTGPFSNLTLACLALTLAILYFVPIKSVQLFAKRVLAFVVDLALLALFTVGVMDLLYQGAVVEPSAIVSMAIVWSWFLLFVLSDWRLKSTPGKLLVGLRLRRASEGNIDLIKCLARNFLTLAVPIIVSGRLLGIPNTYSRMGTIVRLSSGYSLLALLPLSIIFSGGQALPDLLLDIAVLPKRTAINHYPSRLNKKRWLFLFLASTLTGFIIGYATSLQAELARRPPIPPLSVTYESESQSSAWLWPRLQAGIPNPDVFVQNVQVFSASGELPSSIYEALEPTPCSISPKALAGFLIVEVQVRLLTPTPLKADLYRNLQDTFSAEVPANKRPGFLLFEISTKRGFGAFTLTSEEDTVLCLAGSDGKPLNSFAFAGEAAVGREAISEVSVLSLGRLEVYSEIEKLPIWSR